MMHRGKTIKEATTFNVYLNKSQDSEVASKLLDLFIGAYMNSVIDELQTQRDNSCPRSSKEEDESNE